MENKVKSRLFTEADFLNKKRYEHMDD